MSTFDELAVTLANWPEFDVPEMLADPTQERLAHALRTLCDEADKAGPADLGALCRHVLRKEAIRRGQNDLALRVPLGGRWPSERLWKSHGIDVTRVGPDQAIIVARPWRPGWLERQEVCRNALEELKRRPNARLPADPVVTELTGHSSYLSPGQQSAVRAANLLPPGETLLVNLPTGDGKSLVFQTLALRAVRQARMTLIVVPTVALALDQERRLQELLGREGGHKLCYHGGLNDDARKGLLSRVYRGGQGIIITSPESATGGLRRALIQAAQSGRMATIVVDEAHLVSQWGDEFRPEFQLLGALQRTLREASPKELEPTTLLLSATVTQNCIETLRSLFGPFQVLAAPYIRAEPDYWVSVSREDATRTKRVLEALRHVPRPLILYVTRREDAREWSLKLRANGYVRFRLVRGGDLSAGGGTEVLREWTTGKIDCIVATSAFGLGMDHSHVRTVIHACLPESVDRFYQEVGRSGRDGRASLSLLLTTPGDVGVARKLSRTRTISVRVGLERWNEMLRTSSATSSEDEVRVDLNARHAAIQSDSKENRSWNMRTLTLMAKSGLVTLTASTRGDVVQDPSETEKDFFFRRQRELKAESSSVLVRLLTARHNDSATWDREVAPVRYEVAQRDRAALERMLSIRNGDRSVHEILVETYRLTSPRLVPVAAPGHCAHTRDRNRASATHALPPPTVVEVSGPLSGRLADLGRRGIRLITYRDLDRDSLFSSASIFLRLAVGLGIDEIALPESWLSHRDMRNLYLHSPRGFVALQASERSDLLGPDGTSAALPLRRVTLVEPSNPEELLPMTIREIDRDAHFVVLPKSTPSHTHRTRRLVDTEPFVDLEALIQELVA